MAARNQRTVLCTWEVGGELGHISRLSAIAKTLEKAGYRVFVALKDLSRAYVFFSGSNVTLMQAPVWLPKISMQRPIACQADSLLLLGYLEPDPLECLLLAWRALVEAVRPDMVIFDCSPTALLALRSYDMAKLVVGTGFAEPVPGAPLADWRPVPQDDGLVVRQENRVLSVINQVLQRRGEPSLCHLSDLFQVDATLISNPRELDIYPLRSNGRYCLGTAATVSNPLSFSAEGMPRIVAYLKHGHPGFAQLVAGLAQAHANVIAICPQAPPGSLEQWQSPQFQFTREVVDLPTLLAQADLFVGHGNSGSVRESLVAGTPVLVLPIQLEQLLTGQRIQALRVGQMLQGIQEARAVTETVEKMLRERETYRDAIQHLLQPYAKPYITMPEAVLEFCTERWGQ
jgi:hypothetical protein